MDGPTRPNTPMTQNDMCSSHLHRKRRRRFLHTWPPRSLHGDPAAAAAATDDIYCIQQQNASGMRPLRTPRCRPRQQRPTVGGRGHRLVRRRRRRREGAVRQEASPPPPAAGRRRGLITWCGMTTSCRSRFSARCGRRIRLPRSGLGELAG